jgi:ribonuclease HI
MSSQSGQGSPHRHGTEGVGETPDPDLVWLFTDGACSGNPGPGGWAFILRHPSSGKELRLSGAELGTTNNRMELRAAIEGLTALKRRSQVRLVTDSQYVSKGLSEWLSGWKQNGWKRREGRQLKALLNEDLWRELDDLRSRHALTVQHVLGHDGHPENEECDRMAVEAYRTLQRQGASRRDED